MIELLLTFCARFSAVDLFCTAALIYAVVAVCGRLCFDSGAPIEEYMDFILFVDDGLSSVLLCTYLLYIYYLR